MALQDTFKALWFALRHPLTVKQAVRVISIWEGRPRYPATDFKTLAQEGYRRNELIFACIDKIASSAAEPTLRIYDGEEQELPDHPLRQLIERPNPFMTESDFWEGTLSFRSIAGNCYIEKVRSGANRVVELWLLRPDRMTVVPGGDFVEGYQYRVSSHVDTLRAEDVVHIKNFDPLDDFYGLSQIAVCARAGDVDNSITDYTKLFFQNAAVPYGLLKTQQKLTEVEAARIAERWKERYAGPEKWHEIAVLDSDTEYQRLGLTQDEMGFPDLRNITETRICQVFGVPPILVGAHVGLIRSTFANYAEARRAFWEETLGPIYKQLADMVNAYLVPEFGGDVEARWDFSDVSAFREDRDAQWKRATEALRAGGVTVNDFRAEVGLDPVDNGDVFLWPLALVPTLAKIPAPAKALQIADKNLAEIDQFKQIEPDFETRGERYHRQLDRLARAWELRFYEAARDRFQEERKDLLVFLSKARRYKQTPAFDDFLMQAQKYLAAAGEGWRKAFIPLFQLLLSDQAEAFEAQLGIRFDVTSPEVMAFIEDYSFKFGDKVTSVSRDQIADLVRRAQEEGWAIPELQRQLEELYEGWSTVRSEMIARSETIRSSNAGAAAAYKQAGIRAKQWYAALDERTCPYCMALHERLVDIDEDFLGLGESFQPEGAQSPLIVNYEAVGFPPAHVNCRCTILPVVV